MKATLSAPVTAVVKRYINEVLGQPVLDVWEEGDSLVTSWVCFALGAGLSLQKAQEACEVVDFHSLPNVPQKGSTQERWER